jgi:NTE family protein
MTDTAPSARRRDKAASAGQPKTSGGKRQPATLHETVPHVAPSTAARSWRDRKPVLVLQGGGALGSYQAGVCEALDREGMQPTWVAGISIGAINAALIAGNPPERRVERMRAFWEHASSGYFFAPAASDSTFARSWVNQMSAAYIATFGAPGFFAPRFPGPMLAAPGSMEALSFYDTSPLKTTLTELVDFDRINSCETRLSVGAVDIETGNNVLFDNTQMTIGPEHIMASGALPPGFPPVWIDGRAYWDGGLVSNTPLQFVLDEEATEDLLIFQVDLFSARGPMPQNLVEADEREKDIRYSSRTRLNTDQNLRIHRIKVALRRLLKALPEDCGEAEDLRLLHEAAKENAVAIVQLVYRKRPYEGGSKDYEFSRQTMVEHWSSGVSDVEHCFAHADTLLANAPQSGTVVIDPGLHGKPQGANR